MTEPIITMNIITYQAQVLKGKNKKVVMIPFQAVSESYIPFL